MSSSSRTRVLAIGIDAAEPSLVRWLIEHGQMPSLASLLDQGRWLTVESPARVGSGSVWPSLITGETPSEHGVYGEWCWQPERMSLERYSGRGLKPFWQSLAEEGIPVGILDAPFARLVGIKDGFEISEWGPHDCLDGRMSLGPKKIATILSQQAAHPLSSNRLDVAGPNDYESLKKLGEGCLQGVKFRGELAQKLLAETRPQFSLVVFTEIHHSAHHLWHTVEPDHPVYNGNGYKGFSEVKPGLNEIYTEVDRQIGALMRDAGDDASVLVFSLHGMRPTHGIPALLAPLLCEAGFAQLTEWEAKSWEERVVGLFAEMKRWTPVSVKKFYYKSVPQRAAYRLAQTTMLPAYDWSRTRAFSLPSDQHGWIRINLIGRESLGVVSPDEYEDFCGEVERLLLGLRDTEGNRLVHDVERAVTNAESAVRSRLPDLIAHWEDAAFKSPLRVKGFEFVAEAIGTKFTGQHALEGFCIYRGDEGLLEGEVLKATEMGGLMMQMLGMYGS